MKDGDLMKLRISNKTVDVFIKIGLYYLIAYLGFLFIRKGFGVDYLSDKLFTYGLGVMILLTIYVAYINKDSRMFKLIHFTSEKKSFVISMFSILFIGVVIAFNVEIIETNVFTPKLLAIIIASLLIGFGLEIVISFYIKGKKTFKISEFINEKKSYIINTFSIFVLIAMIGFNIEAIVMKSFVPEMLVVTFLSLTIGFCEEGMFRFYIYEKFDCEKNGEMIKAFIISVVMFALLHMVNVAQGMTLMDAWIQSVATINVGIIFSIIYLATKNFAIIAFWHAYIDFNLFITKFGSFPITHKISIILDVLIRIIFVMCLICLGIKIYKNYRRKKVSKNF